MKLAHFEALRPICVPCQVEHGEELGLLLTVEAKREGDDILEGVLQCPSPRCQREYPILDGIPLLVPDVRGYLASQLQQLTLRDDLSPVIEGLLGEASGPGSPLDVTRIQLSSYGWDHYGEWDPASAQAGGLPPTPTQGSVSRTLEVGLELAASAGAPIGEGPLLDIGCAVGRATFDLAGRSAGLVVGVDLGFPMLRLASRVLRRGSARYPLRRGGVLYEWKDFPVPVTGRERVDFWACDAVHLPFPTGSIGGAVALNLLDCVYGPLDLLRSAARVLRPGSTLVVATPYDWSPAATTIDAWIGGHSPRSPGAGASEAILRALLTPGGHPASVAELRLVAERDRVPWTVRLHDRSTVLYHLHLVAATKPVVA